jgi:ABC-type polysaccharide/polyol phosphate export permease
MSYVARMWQCRYFWLSLARLDVRKRYRRTSLGVFWVYAQPAMLAIAMSGVLHRLFDTRLSDHIPAVLTGLCLWNYLTGMLTAGSGCFYWSETYIRQYPAPLAIYPLRLVLSHFFFFLLLLTGIAVLAFALHGVPSAVAALSLLPTLLLIFVAGWSIAVLTGFSNVFFPDTGPLLDIAVQIGFYVTPILYTQEMAAKKHLDLVTDLNPVAAFIQLLRAPLLHGVAPEPTLFLVAAATSGALLAGAIFVLARFERRIAFLL